MQTNWISAKDSLPESGKIVLTVDARIPGSIFVNTFMNTPERGKHWIEQNGHVFYCGVSYWMELPEPPCFLTKRVPDVWQAARILSDVTCATRR